MYLMLNNLWFPYICLSCSAARNHNNTGSRYRRL